MTSKLIDDPLFGRRYGFSRHGELLRIEIWTEPNEGVLAEHVHPGLQERYEVLEGEVTFRVDRKLRRAGPGERLVVPAGVPHSFENTGRGIAHLIVEADPALELRESIEDGVRARTEKLTGNGKPRSLRALIQAAAPAYRYRDTVILSSTPPAMQHLLFPVLAASLPPPARQRSKTPETASIEARGLEAFSTSHRSWRDRIADVPATHWVSKSERVLRLSCEQ